MTPKDDLDVAADGLRTAIALLDRANAGMAAVLVHHALTLIDPAERCPGENPYDELVS